ncbi:MAG: hypothetical protein AAFN92_21895 [Bacteroidota bacterium]
MSAPGKTPSPDYSNFLIYAAIYLAVVFVIMRFSPRLAIGLLALLGVAALAGAGYFLFQRFQQKTKGKVQRNDFKSRVRARLTECRASEHRFREEAEQVRHSIRQLRDDLELGTEADQEEKERGEALVKELRAEFNLRHAKAAFFADCATKLQQLLDRHRLHESINARKKELEQLRQTNFDDEATVEETRYHLEQDTIELDTIAELSRDVAVSFKAEQAEALRARLEQLRAKL